MCACMCLNVCFFVCFGIVCVLTQVHVAPYFPRPFGASACACQGHCMLTEGCDSGLCVCVCVCVCVCACVPAAFEPSGLAQTYTQTHRRDFEGTSAPAFV